MNIVVLVKQVPDSGSERKLDPSDNTVARAAADNVVNEIDEYAIEEALVVKEAHGGERYAHTYYSDEWVAAQGLDLAPHAATLRRFATGGEWRPVA